MKPDSVTSDELNTDNDNVNFTVATNDLVGNFTIAPNVVSAQNMTVISVVYGENGTVNITGKLNGTVYGNVKNYNGNVYITIMNSTGDVMGETRVASVTDGTFTFNNLNINGFAAGSYTVRVSSYADNDNVNFTVATNDLEGNFTIAPNVVSAQNMTVINVTYGVNETVNITGKLNSTEFGNVKT